MGFSENIKNKVKEKAFSRCVICHSPFVEVHHIIPLKENGANTEENAAPLCAKCHDLYGGNPEKRRQIRQMRDQWYREVERKRQTEALFFERIKVLNSDERMLGSKKIAIYHVIFKDEDFNESAQYIFKLVRYAQENNPGIPRCLYLDIEEHRNSQGGFDNDMFELQTKFLLKFLMKYLTEAYTPFGKIVNKDNQLDDVPTLLEIIV